MRRWQALLPDCKFVELSDPTEGLVVNNEPGAGPLPDCEVFELSGSALC